jgi:membrane associated rhomboid family serine protease
MAGHQETSATEALHCYRHPDRETLLSCSSCERPICTSCMTQAAVGVRCPECAGTRGAGPAIRRVREATAGSTVVTTVLVALNLLAFVVEMAQGVAFRGSAGSDLVQNGAVFGPAIADGEWWRLVTGGFLHAGFVHVAFNVWILWILGGVLERQIGSVRLIAIYFSALLWGSAGALLVTPDGFTIGASGGVFGLMAALILLERQRGVALLQSSVGVLLLANLVVTFVIPGISIGGHLGGLLGGAGAAWVLSGYGRGHLAYGRVGPQRWAVVGAVVAAAIVAGLAVA